MSIARGGTTPSQKTITMNVSCPTGSIGNKLYYWFNPVTGTSPAGDGIIDNMLTGSEAASNVGIIFKKDFNKWNELLFWNKWKLKRLRQQQKQ